MEKAEHAERLRAAIAGRGIPRLKVAETAGVKERTVTNWTSGVTMPSDGERAALRALLGDYDSPGDPVEVALRASELVEWRANTVIGFYQRHLAEQHGAAAG